jgi:phosphoribosyl 1,2-cyclic phosphodiesterase
VCNSGSSGNGYVLETDKEALLIEAGCRFADIKKMLNFNVSKIQGLIISHEHG